MKKEKKKKRTKKSKIKKNWGMAGHKGRRELKGKLILLVYIKFREDV